MRKMRLLALAALALPAIAFADDPPAPPAAPPPKKLWTDGKPHPRREVPVTTEAFARLARALGPSVVNVTTVQPGDGPRAQRGRGQGTGFLIEASGYILTNQHVIENAETIKVRLADDREFLARVVGRDEKTDLAVLRIDPGGAEGLPVAPLGDSDAVAIGEWVVAIGNPFGLDRTVTVGIVSAKGRRDVRPGGSTQGYYDFLQTDASINAGNSGGPLINLAGEVIGINTAMNAQGQGIAFAIPVNMAKAIVPLLVAHGRAPRSWLGLYPQSVTATLKHAFGLSDTRGALVADVVAGGPAERAGILPGDVITVFDGKPIRRADDLQWWVGLGGAGRQVSLTVVRAGAERKLVAILAAQPDDAAAAAPVGRGKERASPLGMSVSQITEGIARELGQPGLRGVVVMSVEAESPAAEAGVEKGDVLLRVGDTEVRSLDDYAAAVRAVPRGEMIKLLARRDGHNLWLAFAKR